MSTDVIILVLVLFFAVMGMFSGAARQIAQLIALAVAWVASGPLGAYLGPPMARALEGPLMMGVVFSTVLIFFTVLLLVRLGLTYGLQRLMGVDESERQWTDRMLG